MQILICFLSLHSKDVDDNIVDNSDNYCCKNKKLLFVIFLWSVTNFPLWIAKIENGCSISCVNAKKTYQILYGFVWQKSVL